MFTSLAKVDWNAFEYIHSSNSRDAFQNLTEQLFCFEFKQPYGIYRYYNQPHIETMPVRVGNDYIGFQSKYYDASTALSDKEQELINAIDGAYTRYPGINKMILYINKEAGMSTAKGKTAPAYIERIVSHGASKGITVEWRGLNELETMLLNPVNSFLRDYFFATDGGIRKVFAHIKDHTNTIFKSLSSEIKYRDQIIKISHPCAKLESLWDSDKNISILHGNGGCGKSGLVKDMFEHITEYPVMAFKATDFDCSSLSEFSRKFGDCIWDDLLQSFDDSPRKLCIIDSAEKALSMEYQDTLYYGIQALHSHGWKILFTIRSMYIDNFTNCVLRTDSFDEVYIPTLSVEMLSELEQKYSFSLPVNPELRDLLCNLFYLNLYLSQERMSETQTTADFFESIWQYVICKTSVQANSMHMRRGKMICKIAQNIADSGFFYYIPDDNTDWDAITALHESEILHLDNTMGGYFFAHDVYEELVLRQIISQEFSRKVSASSFFSSIGDSLLVRKSFRIWLHNQFEFSFENIEQFLSEVLQSTEISSVWKDDILIALMSENNNIFTNHLDNILEKEDYVLLPRAIHLLNTACKIIDNDLCQKLFTPDEIKTNIIYRHVKPAGMGWSYLISYIYANREKITWSSITISLAIEMLYAWTRHNPEGATTRNAGLVALFFYSKVAGINRTYSLDEAQISKVCDAILFSAIEINTELSCILEEVISKEQTSHRELYYSLCNHLLENTFNTGKLCESNPDIVIRLAKCFWLEGNQNTSKWGHGIDLGPHFGLREHTDHMYYPASAFQTPILVLLKTAPVQAVDFIVELFDYATNAYQNSRLNIDYKEISDIEIVLSDHEKVRQKISERLWKMHRGTHVGPHLLVSVLMALERWLYEILPTLPDKTADAFCMKLISRTSSTAITSVIVSMVIAYPQKLFKTACCLLQTKEIFRYDLSRLTSERTAGLFPPIASNKIFTDERQRSNSLPFRKKRFEEILLDYQINQVDLTDEAYKAKMTDLYSAFDKAFSPEEQLPTYAKFVLYRMDIRKMSLVKAEDADGKKQIALVPELPDTMVQIQKQTQKNGEKDEKFARLRLWTTAHMEQRISDYMQYSEYESNPINALNVGLEFVENPCFVQLDNLFMVYVAAVLLIDFQDKLDPDSLDTCQQMILHQIQKVIDERGYHSVGDGTDAAIAALPALLGKTRKYSVKEDPSILLLMLLCDCGFQRNYAIKIFSEKMWQHEDLAHKIISLFINLKPLYDKEVSKHNGISPFKFFKKHISLIKSTLEQPIQPLPDYSTLSTSALITLNLLMPKEPCELVFSVLKQTGVLLWPKIFKDRWQYHDDDNWSEKHEQSHTYINWFSKALLQLDSTEQNCVLSLLLPYLNGYDVFKDLLSSLIFTEDALKRVSSFWNVWNQLFPTIEALCEKEKESILKLSQTTLGTHYRRCSDELITTYMLASPWWKEGIKEWHTLRQEDSNFFATAVTKIGYHPAVLYSVTHILNSVGFIYANEGVKWLATLILNNSHLCTCDLLTNTLYYLEEYVQQFCNNNRNNIKRNAEIKNALATVLNFLVDRGSTCGYMLREQYC